MANDKKRYGFRDNYFQDHSRKIVLGMDGNPRVEYVYEGIYYSLEGTDRQWNLSKLYFTLLTTGAAACLLLAMLTETPGNHMTDITVLEVISMFLLFGVGIGVFNRLTAPRQMTKWEYRMGVVTIKEFSLLLLVSLAALLLDEAVSMMTGRLAWDGTNVLLMGKLALCFALVLAQLRKARKERYQERFSDDLPNGIDITNDFEAMP